MERRVIRLRLEIQHTDPKVWRRVDVPIDYTLDDLDPVMQVAFEWDGDHLSGYQFTTPALAKLGLEGPFAWRLPDEQVIMGLPLLKIHAAKVKRFQYTYDYGDSWNHIVTILRVLDAKPGVTYPHLVAGATAAPIEDLSGHWGYYRMVEVAEDPKHPDRPDYEERFGAEWLDSYDINHFDRETIERGFARIAGWKK